MKPKKTATPTVKRANSLRAKSSRKNKSTNLFLKIIQNSVSKLKNKPTAIVVISVLVLAGFFTFVYFKGSSTSALSAKTYNCQYDGTTTYREGSKGNCVKFIQAVVNGYMLCSNKTTRVSVDGIFGTKTSDGVVAFKNGNKNAILAAGGNLEPTVGKQAWGVMVKWSDANQKCMDDANLPPKSPAVSPSTANLALMKSLSCSYDGSTTYDSGDKANCVKYTQAILNGWKQCNNKALTKISISGVFDPATVGAVLEFKNANEKDILAARGTLEPIIGPQAWGVLLKYHETNQKCVSDANPSLFTTPTLPSGSTPTDANTSLTPVSDANTTTTTTTNSDYVVLKEYGCNYDGKTTYRAGDRGGCIKYIQAIVNAWKECQNGGSNKIDINGTFDQATKDAVVEFKKANQKAILDANGNLDPEVGPQTWGILVVFNKMQSQCVDKVTGLKTTPSSQTSTSSSGESGANAPNGTSGNGLANSSGGDANNPTSDANSGVVSNVVGAVSGAANTIGSAVSSAATSVKDFFVGFFNKPFVKSTQKKYDCKYDGKTTFKLGTKDNCVEYIQTIINAEKYCSGRGDYVIRTGKFDKATESAVIDFKQARSKEIKKAKADFDGQVGPQAWKVIVKYNATHKKCANKAIESLGDIEVGGTNDEERVVTCSSLGLVWKNGRCERNDTNNSSSNTSQSGCSSNQVRDGHTGKCITPTQYVNCYTESYFNALINKSTYRSTCAVDLDECVFLSAKIENINRVSNNDKLYTNTYRCPVG